MLSMLVAVAALAAVTAACSGDGSPADHRSVQSRTAAPVPTAAAIRPPPVMAGSVPPQPAAPIEAAAPSPVPEDTPVPTATSVARGDTEVATVVYEDGTFTPKRLEVDVGKAVKFVNESDKPMWPASNIHPTHEIYRDFDARQPVPEGESWVFTFEETGFWRYHDHMSPASSGLVVALGGESGTRPEPLIVNPRELSFKEPGRLSIRESVDLFTDDALLARFVREYGPANTVGLLAQYESRVDVDCHQRAHVMGRVAYELYGAAAFSLSGHECHSGSYHGATEAFFRDRGTLSIDSDVQVVCGNDLNRFFRHQCVHGIGHGLMAWTSYEIFDALGLCDELGDAVDQRSCYSGVFMENVVGGLSGQMGHYTEYLSDDPHFPCNTLEERYLAPCYFFQSSRMLQVFAGDFEKVAQACGEAPEVAHRECFQSMGRDIGGVTRGEPDRAISLCYHAQDPANRQDCLVGAAQDAFWDAQGADDALAFCRLLDDTLEKERCYSTIIVRAHSIYQRPPELRAFCARVEDGFREGCP